MLATSGTNNDLHQVALRRITDDLVQGLRAALRDEVGAHVPRYVLSAEAQAPPSFEASERDRKSVASAAVLPLLEIIGGMGWSCEEVLTTDGPWVLTVRMFRLPSHR